MGNPNRICNVAYALSNASKHSATPKSPSQAEADLINQIIVADQPTHHSQIPGGNRKERRLLARKVRHERKARGLADV